MIKPITWPAERMPTPEEWLEWFQSHLWYDEDGVQGEDDQLRIVGTLLDRLYDAAQLFHTRDTLLIQIKELELKVDQIQKQRSR